MYFEDIGDGGPEIARVSITDRKREHVVALKNVPRVNLQSNQPWNGLAPDNSPVIALHTSAIMTVALPMYIRMGFERHRDAPAVYGVPYAVYLKRLVP